MPALNENAYGSVADVSCLAIDPRDCRGVGAHEPRGLDTVVQAQGIQADQERAEMQVPVRARYAGLLTAVV